MRRIFTRLTAALTAFVLLTAPAAQALTPEQAAELLSALYVDEVPQAVLEQPTVEGMVNALGDPYTEYFSAEEYAVFTASMSDESLVGIGIVFTITDKGLLLNEVLEGSPAQKAGMKAGDVIVAVDGHSVLGQDQDTLTGWIQGKEGTSVRLRYRRNGIMRFANLIRAVVVVPTTTVELVDGHIGYITCSTFGQETAQHFREGFEAYGSDATVWIVDLRGNVGGITAAAAEAAGYFTGEGQMAYLRNGLDEYSGYYHEDESLTLAPVIVLMDPLSASSSEIFAGAIQDHGAGIVVGTRSYGKGVAQTVLDQEHFPEFFPEGDALKITSHRFFTPHGNSTDQVGVIPNVLVSEDMVVLVARLLAGMEPRGDTKGLLRIDLRWQWYLSDEDIKADLPAFQALLNALPQDVRLLQGTGGPEGWHDIDPDEAAKEYSIQYTPPLFPDQDQSKHGGALSALKSCGLIHGKEDGLFHPQDTLTRAELCQMLAEALNCAMPKTPGVYSDVPNDAWYAPAVTAMTNMGLVTGMEDGTFQPEAPVDHQQLITILGRLSTRFNFYLYDALQAMPEDALAQAELEDYAPWARPSAWLLGCSQTNGFGGRLPLLWTTVDEIEPTAAATRDEAAYLLYRILSYTGILPV